MRFRLYLLPLWLLCLAGAIQPALAQQSAFESVAEYLVVDGDSVTDGDIVIQDGEILRESARPYENALFGVVNVQPALAIKISSGPSTDGELFPIVMSGTVSVNVSGEGGAIDAGDFVVSSSQAGIGMRANDPGVVLGRALQPFAADTVDEVGQIIIALDIHFVAIPDEDVSVPSTLISQVRRALVTGAAQAVSDPNTALRYALAATVIIVSLVLGLLIFGRSATHGVVAVGRNPLARRTILAAVSFNVFMTIVFIGGGVAAAFFILAL